MAYVVLTEDPSTRDVGDLIIMGNVDVLGQLNQNFVDSAASDNDTQENDPVRPSDSDEAGADDDNAEEEDDDEEEDDESDPEAEDDDTDSERA